MNTHVSPDIDPTTKMLMSRLWQQHIRVHINKIMVAVVCMVVVAAATAANAWMMQPVLDKIFLEKDTTMLMIIPLAVLSLFIIKGTATYAQSVMMKSIGQRIITDMQLKLYGHLLHADIGMLAKHHSGNLISRFTNDINVMRGSFTNALTGVAKEVLTLVFLIGVMFYQNVMLACIAFVVFPLAFYPVYRLGKRMRKLSKDTQVELGHFTNRLDETFQGIRMVKAYGQEDHERERASAVVEGLYRLYVKAARVESASSPLMEILSGVAIAAIIWYGGAQVLEGVTTPGSFFSFITALIMAYKPIKTLTNLNNIVQQGLAAATRLFEILDTQPKIQDRKKAQALTFKGGHIQFEQVLFQYDDEAHALQSLNLDIPAGKMVALVGSSGAGKSTIMNLILRFYDPQSGAITIDGTDVRDVTMSSLREQMAIVSQEITLFGDTIRANIAYGKLDATDEEIVEASKAAAAHDFISELPDGYDTYIGQHGLRLSGGQRQRIAIARAMLRNAPILLLDEATSALDTISEQHIQSALETLMKGRTTLVIAHRLSTVMNADIIYVLKDGQVLESGKHQDLLLKEGEYSKLYATQFDS